MARARTRATTSMPTPKKKKTTKMDAVGETADASTAATAHNATSPWLELPTVALVAIATETPDGVVTLASTCTALRKAFGPKSDVAECVLAHLAGSDARGLLQALAVDPSAVIERQAEMYRRLDSSWSAHAIARDDVRFLFDRIREGAKTSDERRKEDEEALEWQQREFENRNIDRRRHKEEEEEENDEEEAKDDEEDDDDDDDDPPQEMRELFRLAASWHPFKLAGALSYESSFRCTTRRFHEVVKQDDGGFDDDNDDDGNELYWGERHVPPLLRLGLDNLVTFWMTQTVKPLDPAHRYLMCGKKRLTMSRAVHSFVCRY